MDYREGRTVQSAARMNIMYAVGHGTGRDLCVMETVKGQMTLKTNVDIFGFSRLSTL